MKPVKTSATILLTACGFVSAISLAQMQTPDQSKTQDQIQQQDQTQTNDQPTETKTATPMMTPAPMTEVAPKTENGVTYMCGGIGKPEAQAMRHTASQYDLMLTFATKQGEFLADVNVDIKDAGGNTVLQTSCDAPILLVDVPKTGIYRIHAEANGYALDKTASIKAKKRGTPVVLLWPQKVA